MGYIYLINNILLSLKSFRLNLKMEYHKIIHISYFTIGHNSFINEMIRRRFFPQLDNILYFYCNSFVSIQCRQCQGQAQYFMGWPTDKLPLQGRNAMKGFSWSPGCPLSLIHSLNIKLVKARTNIRLRSEAYNINC